ncbi:hypothetical protein HOK51_03730 [Candidatus Woesearchaeota archaeon]|jgi:hypothetical protein|nr:hypothetical protein [Candidatus Woesearchaeota archaeon]MBT6518932.1 hypothetical protein [Candidatus Woesearchaeota archaeon]MBT7367600.1 hypothetical protein [Candidatus Woesearchaeota archaeon]
MKNKDIEINLEKKVVSNIGILRKIRRKASGKFATYLAAASLALSAGYFVGCGGEESECCQEANCSDICVNENDGGCYCRTINFLTIDESTYQSWEDDSTEFEDDVYCGDAQ